MNPTDLDRHAAHFGAQSAAIDIRAGRLSPDIATDDLTEMLSGYLRMLGADQTPRLVTIARAAYQRRVVAYLAELAADIESVAPMCASCGGTGWQYRACPDCMPALPVADTRCDEVPR